jgi:hypothetical protein
MLLMELQEKRDDLSAADMHTALSQRGILRCTLEQVEETVDKMIKAGQRYKYLEKTLGPGVALVLGKEVPESMCAIIAPFFMLLELTNVRWTKALPKGRPISKEVVDRLKSVGLPELGAKYSELERTLLQYGRQRLVALYTA